MLSAILGVLSPFPRSLWRAPVLRTNSRWVLLEGAPQLGGRLKNAAGLPKVPARLGVDLGAAWCWPGQQPKVRALLQTLGVGAFEQPDDRGGGTYRVRGGTHALVAALEATSTAQGRGDVRLGWSLEACALVDQGGQGVGGQESAPVVRLTSQTGEVRSCLLCARRRGAILSLYLRQAS